MHISGVFLIWTLFWFIFYFYFLLLKGMASEHKWIRVFETMRDDLLCIIKKNLRASQREKTRGLR